MPKNALKPLTPIKRFEFKFEPADPATHYGGAGDMSHISSLTISEIKHILAIILFGIMIMLAGGW